MSEHPKHLTILGEVFLNIDYGILGSLWKCALEHRTLLASPTIEEAFLQQIHPNKTPFVTGYLVPDEDFNILRSERLISLKFNFNYLTINMPPLYYKPMDMRLAGQSITDFLTLFRLEQYDGLAGYGESFIKPIEGLLAKILPEDSEEYELEAKLKTVLHAFNSKLLKTVIKEIRAAFLEEEGNVLEIEKKLIRLKLELEGFLKHQKRALSDLVEALGRIKDRSFSGDFSYLALCVEALYQEILDNPSQSWIKITLLVNFIESEIMVDSWVTFPKKRQFLTPFILKCAYEAIKGRFTKEQLSQSILRFDEIALNLSTSRLQGLEPSKESLIVDSIQQAFYQIAALFSKSGHILEAGHAVYDQSALLLIPAFVNGKPLLKLEGEMLVPTNAGVEILMF